MIQYCKGIRFNVPMQNAQLWLWFLHYPESNLVQYQTQIKSKLHQFNSNTGIQQWVVKLTSYYRWLTVHTMNLNMVQQESSNQTKRIIERKHGEYRSTVPLRTGCYAIRATPARGLLWLDDSIKALENTLSAINSLTQHLTFAVTAALFQTKLYLTILKLSH